MATIKGSLLSAVAKDLERRLERLFSIESAPPKLRLSRIGLCPRQTVWSVREGVETDLTEAAGILAAGKLYESFIAEMFEGEDIIEQMEVSLAGVPGHLDFFLPRLRLVIECKTIAAARIDSALLPIEHHVLQLHAYLSALKEMGYGENIGALIYLPRENPRLFKVFTFAYDESIHSELVLRLELLKDAIENGRDLPIPDGYEKNKFPCSWFSKISRMHLKCPFYERCWVEVKQEKAMQASGENQDQDQDASVTQFEMTAELEELVAIMHELRIEKQRIEDELKSYRKQVLEAVEQMLKAKGKKVNFDKKQDDSDWKAFHLLGTNYGLTIVRQVRSVLDTEALSKVVDLNSFKKTTTATVVDVYRLHR